MSFSENIKNLLLFSGRVTFPGLGSLELVKESARMKGKKIIPPGTIIIFNPDISLDDGKLAQSVASEGDSDIEEAKQKVLELVDKIVFSLNKGESFVFEGVGNLYKDENNTIHFENDPGLILDFESFGLESFELEPLGEEVSKDAGKAEEDIKSVDSASQEHTVPPYRERKKTGTYLKDVKMKAGTGILWYIISSIILLLGVIFIIWCRTDILDEAYYKIFNKSKKDSVNLLTGDKSLPSVDLEKTIDSSVITDKTIKQIEKETIPLNKLSSETAGYKEYHIIAGSFRDTINAQDLARELTIKGYPVFIIEQPNNLFRVSAMSFRDKESGLKELTRFRGKTKNNAAWLLELGN